MEAPKPAHSKFRPIPRPSLHVTPPTLQVHLEVIDLYNELLHEYRELDRRTSEREQRYRAIKASLKDWHAYINRKYHTPGRSSRNGPQPITPLPLDLSSPALSEINASKQRGSESTHQPFVPSRLRETEMASVPARPMNDAPSLVSARSNSPTLQITSSQTTQGNLSSPTIAQTPEEGSSPVIVMTRSLKRKRDPTSRHTVERDVNMHDGTASRPVAVKEESRSSPIRNYPALLRMETSDLDAYTDLPAATNLGFSQSLRAVALHCQQANASTRPNPPLFGTNPLQRTNLDNPEPTAQNLSTNNAELQPHHSSENRFESPPMSLKDATFDEEAALDGQRTPRANESAGQATTPPERHSAGPLQPLSNNTPIVSSFNTSNHDKSKTTRKYRDSGAGAIHILSEDGHEPRRSAKKPKPSSDQTPKTSTTHRLSDLLEGAVESPAKTVLSPRVGSSVRKPRDHVEPQIATPSIERPVVKNRKTVQDRVPPRHNLKLTDGLETADIKHERLRSQSVERPVKLIRKTVRDRASPKKLRVSNYDPGPINPDDEPLRSRPLHRLNITDFKVDPRYASLGYEYRETIRKRDERRCLPGCTKPCCHSIRKMAVANVMPSLNRSRALFDDDEDTMDDDEFTLRGYLGKGYTQMIRSANAEEKNKMLIEARAKAFADKHGKHRQVFERRASPPGFWRTDMPTTQEEEEDRKEADRQERQIVEERWREAMRGGGRYMFRDE